VVPQLKARIAQVTLEQCRALAQRALELPTAQAVRALLAAQPGGVP
jgi:phosphoenolpyruvate-protein kinase (PTS system EI component)